MPVVATVPVLGSDPDTAPHTAVTTTLTSLTSPRGTEEAPRRSPAWRQGAASPVQLTEVVTTEATAEAEPAAPAGEVRTEAAPGRGGKSRHQRRTFFGC
jgi:hypothetical protein